MTKGAILSAFNRSEAGGNGSIERGDLSRLLQLLEPGIWDGPAVDKLLTAFDDSGDAYICFKGFLTWLGLPESSLAVDAVVVGPDGEGWYAGTFGSFDRFNLKADGSYAISEQWSSVNDIMPRDRDSEEVGSYKLQAIGIDNIHEFQLLLTPARLTIKDDNCGDVTIMEKKKQTLQYLPQENPGRQICDWQEEDRERRRVGVTIIGTVGDAVPAILLFSSGFYQCSRTQP